MGVSRGKAENKTKNNIVKLTDKILASLDSKDFIAIALAVSGAMGDPGSINIVDRSLKIYHTHFGEIDEKILREKIPFLKTLKVCFDDIDGLGEDWAGLSTGYGNYLFVRPEYEKPILRYISDNYSDTGMREMLELYAHWYEALEEVIP